MHRRFFNPALYRIVLLDQRNCGRSLPHAGDHPVNLAWNTTFNLVGDIERLRMHLGIERWLVFGGSWGCVLALAYAEKHREKVSELVLTGIATGRREETDLLTRGLGTFFPEAWARFRDGVPANQRDGDLALAYSTLLFNRDPAVRARAAANWCEWEQAINPAAPRNLRYESPLFRQAFARIVTHYWAHGSWLSGPKLLREARRLAGIPGVMVQGSLDFGNLLGTPWELRKRWPGSRLILVADPGHDAQHPRIRQALVDAIDRFGGVT